jgi:MFS transporter
VLSGTARHSRPTRFRDVFASAEFRSLYAASALSWLGDFVARAAVTALVFDQTKSVAISAAAFAISFAPWLLGGYLLVAVAERHRYRRVMVWCDLARMALMGLVAIPGLPTWGMLALLLLTALFGPPFDAARSATLPAILGERYVTGLALHTSTGPPVQVLGYFLGASLAGYSPRLALVVNAATFGLSALLIRLGVQAREPGLSRDSRTGLLRETGDGFRVVLTNPALRAIVLLVFAGSLFAIVPEGLAAAWSTQFAGELDRGWAQGLIMGAVPFGMILGSLIVTRLVPVEERPRLLRPLGLATPLALVPVFVDPPAPVVAAFALASGFAVGALVPVANGEFVQALPNAYRARAFGVVQGGLHLLQGSAVLITGALALRFDLPRVVGLWSLGGVGLMVLLVLFWPSSQVFDRAKAAAAAANGVGPGKGGVHRAPEPAAEVPSDEPPPHDVPVIGVLRRREAATQPGTMEP